jgi:hypothetical protein
MLDVLMMIVRLIRSPDVADFRIVLAVVPARVLSLSRNISHRLDYQFIVIPTLEPARAYEEAVTQMNQ